MICCVINYIDKDMFTFILVCLQLVCTVKYVYSVHAYNEITIITKHLSFSISHYKCYAYSEVAYN